jgi:hypothetical protein
VADFIYTWPDKEEKESLIEHFRSLQIDNEKAGAQMDVQEQAPIQIPAKKPPKPRKNNSKSRAFSNSCCIFFPKINSQRKTGLNLENFWMTDFCIFSQNRPKFGI